MLFATVLFFVAAHKLLAFLAFSVFSVGAVTSNRVAATSPDSPTTPVQAFDSAFGAAEYTAAGAIAQKEGYVFLKAGSAAAMTLVAPTAGAPSAAGDDGKEITIIAEDAFAYTVTTPANKINGAKHIATWTAAIGNGMTMIAFNGIWYAVVLTGVALT